MKEQQLDTMDYSAIEEGFKVIDRQIFQIAKEYQQKLQKIEKEQQLEINQAAAQQTKHQFLPQSPTLKQDFIKDSKLIGQISQNINGYQIKHSLLQIDDCCNDMTLPRAIKHIMCIPAAPIKLVCAASLIKESLGCMDASILSQFYRDATQHNFDTLKLPVNLIKYEDEVMINNATGEIHYVLRILYEGPYQRFKYTYDRGMNEAEGQFKIQAFDYISNE
eukprot:403345172